MITQMSMPGTHASIASAVAWLGAQFAPFEITGIPPIHRPDPPHAMPIILTTRPNPLRTLKRWPVSCSTVYIDMESFRDGESASTF